MLYATAQLRQRPASRYSKGQLGNNFQVGPFKWGCSVLVIGALIMDYMPAQGADAMAQAKALMAEHGLEMWEAPETA